MQRKVGAQTLTKHMFSGGKFGMQVLVPAAGRMSNHPRRAGGGKKRRAKTEGGGTLNTNLEMEVIDRGR